MSADLNLAKQRLIDKLGPRYNSYIQLLGRWFRGALSKEEFDKHARQLNDQDFALEHNRFWLAFFHHCANNAASNQTRNFQAHDATLNETNNNPSNEQGQITLNDTTRVRCLPNKMLMHMRVFVIAWESGLDSVDDRVSSFVKLALQYFLKNIITGVICTKTAYRLRENRFKYAVGVKPMNPYLSNSLRVFSNSLEYDPYQIESNKMNSSILDTCIYNDTLFPSRLHETQALYEYACSTTSISSSISKSAKRLKLSEIFLNQYGRCANQSDIQKLEENSNSPPREQADPKNSIPEMQVSSDQRGLNMYNLLFAFITDKTLIPSHSLYSINLERIFTKLSN